MNITESIKFNKLQEENEKLKNQLAEKDKEHKEQLKRMYEQFKHDKELEINQYKFEFKQQQLFKEDFIIGENHNGSIETYEEDNTFYTDDIKYVLKDNLKYDKLPSKDVK